MSPRTVRNSHSAMLSFSYTEIVCKSMAGTLLMYWEYNSIQFLLNNSFLILRRRFNDREVGKANQGFQIILC